MILSITHKVIGLQTHYSTQKQISQNFFLNSNLQIPPRKCIYYGIVVIKPWRWLFFHFTQVMCLYWSKYSNKLWKVSKNGTRDQNLFEALK